MNRKPSKKILEAAKTLSVMIESGKHTEVQWTYSYLGDVLGLSITQAKVLMHYLRNNDPEMIWTVGTFKTDYSFVATKETRTALDGLVNQARHSLTRDLTALHQARVLSEVDPDPRFRRIWIRQEVLMERRVADGKAYLQEMFDLLKE